MVEIGPLKIVHWVRKNISEGRKHSVALEVNTSGKEGDGEQKNAKDNWIL